MAKTEGNTVRLHRVLRAPAERIYKHCIDPMRWQKWLPAWIPRQGHTENGSKVGGGYKMSFTNFSNGSSHSFDGKIFGTGSK